MSIIQQFWQTILDVLMCSLAVCSELTVVCNYPSSSYVLPGCFPYPTLLGTRVSPHCMKLVFSMSIYHNKVEQILYYGSPLIVFITVLLKNISALPSKCHLGALCYFKLLFRLFEAHIPSYKIVMDTLQSSKMSAFYSSSSIYIINVVLLISPYY